MELKSGRLFHAFALSTEQVIDAGLHFFRAVDVEDEVRYVARAHALVQLVADESAGSHETFEGVLLFLCTSIDGDIDDCGFSTGVEQDLRDIGEADARVGEFPLDHGADFVAERACDPIAMVLTCPWFRHLILPLWIKRLRITEVASS